MELHPLQKLDAILNFINSHQKAANRLMSFDEIKLGHVGSNITEYELTNILLKLQKDKFIEIDEHIKNDLTKHFGATIPIPTAAGAYRITFEGQVFIESGGYVNNFNRENKEKEIAKRNETLLRRYSLIAAIGAGGILVWEIIKWLLDKFDCCNCHH